MAEATTTIKVPVSLRDEIARNAERDGVSAAAYLAGVLAERRRTERFAAVRAAYGQADEGYLAETAHWDEALADGLAG